MIQTVESTLTFLSGVGRITFWLLCAAGFVSLSIWVGHRFLTGAAVLPVGGCMGVVLKGLGFVLLCLALGSYFGSWVRDVTVDSTWVQGFFSLAAVAIGIFLYANFVGQRE